jgi:hypothetical protein
VNTCVEPRKSIFAIVPYSLEKLGYTVRPVDRNIFEINLAMGEIQGIHLTEITQGKQDSKHK